MEIWFLISLIVSWFFFSHPVLFVDWLSFFKMMFNCGFDRMLVIRHYTFTCMYLKLKVFVTCKTYLFKCSFKVHFYVIFLLLLQLCCVLICYWFLWLWNFRPNKTSKYTKKKKKKKKKKYRAVCFQPATLKWVVKIKQSDFNDDHTQYLPPIFQLDFSDRMLWIHKRILGVTKIDLNLVHVDYFSTELFP